MQLTFLSACRKGCNGSGIKPKLISKLSAANLVSQVDTIHLRVACYGRIRVKQLERCAKKKNKKITSTLKSDGECFQKLGYRSCRTRCKGSRMGPKWILGGGGTVGCRPDEINKGWGVAGTKQGRLSATDPCPASNQQSC
jgi:hypothetical protein